MFLPLPTSYQLLFFDAEKELYLKCYVVPTFQVVRTGKC